MIVGYQSVGTEHRWSVRGNPSRECPRCQRPVPIGSDGKLMKHRDRTTYLRCPYRGRGR
jgi:hypothetical protein